MTHKSFETLKTWQKAPQLMLDIHKKLIPFLPKEEKYGLADQLRRLSKSVPTNISWLKEKKNGNNKLGSKLVIRETPSDYFIDTD